MQFGNSALSIGRGLAALVSSPEEAQRTLPGEIREAFKFFRQPEVQTLIQELQQSIFDFMLTAPGPLEAVNWKDGLGTYVREGVRELLTTPQADGNIPLALSRFGGVDLVTGEHKLCMGHISIASSSPMHRQEFVNKSSSVSVEKSVFQLEQVSSWVPLERVVQGDTSGFILNDRLSLAAEIVMTFDYMFVYAQIAGDIAQNEQDAGEVLLKMKIGANLDDCLDAARYCRVLEERLQTVHNQISRQAQWKALKGPSPSALIEEVK